VESAGLGPLVMLAAGATPAGTAFRRAAVRVMGRKVQGITTLVLTVCHVNVIPVMCCSPCKITLIATRSPFDTDEADVEVVCGGAAGESRPAGNGLHMVDILYDEPLQRGEWASFE